MQGGYATADATISLQSTSSWLRAKEIICILLGSNLLLLFAEVAWQLGYEDVDAVTVEDLGLEVEK